MVDLNARMSNTADCSPHVARIEYNDTDITTAATVNTPTYSNTHTLILIRVSLVTTSIVLMLFSVLALIALSRTKNIPKTACILSTSLLFFDCVTVLTYGVRNIVTDPVLLNIITLVGIGWATSSFINVAVMALDRLILFQWPYFYVRRFTNGSYVTVYYIIIAVYLIIFSGHWVNCFISMSDYRETRQCMLPLIIGYMTVTQSVSVLVCIPCFLWIAVIIIKQRQKKRSRSEKNPTIVVFVCCINYGLSTIGVFILLYTICQFTIIARRTATDIIHFVNVLVDTAVYVLWFKECRYELFKIIGCLIPPLRQRIERMRNEVFDVTGSGGTTSTSVP